MTRQISRSILASRPAATGSILGIPKIFLMLPWFIDSVHCLDSGQCKKSLIVDRTHPVLVRAVLQKKFSFVFSINVGWCNRKFDCPKIPKATKFEVDVNIWHLDWVQPFQELRIEFVWTNHSGRGLHYGHQYFSHKEYKWLYAKYLTESDVFQIFNLRFSTYIMKLNIANHVL